MKRVKVLASCSALVLALLLAVAGVQAQTYRAEIPFDFTIGSETFEAGEYIINLKDSTGQATILTVRNDKNQPLQSKAVVKNGKVASDGHTSLVFARYGSQYVLKRVTSPNFGFNAPRSTVETRLARNSTEPMELVSVILANRDRNVE